MKKTHKNRALLKAIKVAGSQKALGEMISRTQQAISYYKNNKMKPHVALEIEAATGVSREELLPDYDWHKLKKTPPLLAKEAH